MKDARVINHRLSSSAGGNMVSFYRNCCFCVLLFLTYLVSVQQTNASEAIEVCELVVPVSDSKGVISEPDTDGKTYPLFRKASDSILNRRIGQVLSSGLAQKMLRLNHYAQNLIQSETAGSRATVKFITPMYLLLSEEEGGYARFGFWLEQPSGQHKPIKSGYVNLVVDDQSVNTGHFEEIFCHELGHVILRELIGDLSCGPNRKMHLSMTLTDYPTAFDEGYAEHFQPLARDMTTNTFLLTETSGKTATDLDSFWLSRLDLSLRTYGVKQNLFVHRKALPVRIADPASDPYVLFVDGETSPEFVPDALKTGQEMLSSEGVIATIFYRLVNNEHLRNTYRSPSFYANFGASKKDLSTYENVSLKLFAAMRELSRSWQKSDGSLVTALVSKYAELFPDEADEIYQLFLSTTYGATASGELKAAFEKAMHSGRRGQLDAFKIDSRTAFSMLKKVTQQVATGNLPIDANVGPQLWLLNNHFKIGSAIWVTDRTVALSINMNTASVPELMTLPGIDFDIASRIVARRNAVGFFRNLDDLNWIGSTPFRSLMEASRAMQASGNFKRP